MSRPASDAALAAASRTRTVRATCQIASDSPHARAARPAGGSDAFPPRSSEISDASRRLFSAMQTRPRVRSDQASSCAESTERARLIRPQGPIAKARTALRPGRSISRDRKAHATSSRRKRPRVAYPPPPDADAGHHPDAPRPQPRAPAHQEGIPAYRPWESGRRGGRAGEMCNPGSSTSRAVPRARAPRSNSGRPAPRTNFPPLPKYDDNEGHLIFKLGDGLFGTPEFPHGRYKILCHLGEGTFGKVVECWDRRVCRRVAVKIVRSITKYREAAKLEIDVLVHVSYHDPEGVQHCVKMFSWFDHFAHVCMVFEKLGPSLYEHLRMNRFQPFSIDEVRTYAQHLLESVSYVHSLTLIHTDLKPENILLERDSEPDADQAPQRIKLIDFGSATFEAQHHSTVISTRHYRAPEVILGLGWTYPCDLWSVGCILVELYTGQALFQTHENLEHLAMMSVVLGPIPQTMILRADANCQEYFVRGSDGCRYLNWPQGASSKSSIRSVRRVHPLSQLVRGDDVHNNFLDLLRRLLAFEPETRCTSEEALRHPFFLESPIESDHPTTAMNDSSASSPGADARDVRGRRVGHGRTRQAPDPGRTSAHSYQADHRPAAPAANARRRPARSRSGCARPRRETAVAAGET